ncbi:MAG: hypothetical protein HN564_08305 [Flavobacteriales bacterium]|nr:hypothetical protein [Flavobacteriales bacterium]
MNAIIFGSGPSRTLIDKVPAHIFTVSCNLSYPNANLIFARDEPILEKVLKEKTPGFEDQLVFTTFREYEKYSDTSRVILLDEDKLFSYNQGLSTGTLAIATMLNFGFKKIYLCGFTFEKPGGSLQKLLQVIGKSSFSKLYCIGGELLLLEPPVPNFITKEVFYNGYR